jgi:hypothetical protein
MHMTTSKNRRTPPDSPLLEKLKSLLQNPPKGRELDAQDLVEDAWEASDAETAFGLFAQATELDPTNADAWIGLMDLEPTEPAERIGLVRYLVELAGNNLGKEKFREHKGQFWDIVETRPYMRIRAYLALELTNVGWLDEAIAESEALLELNPDDSLGVRFGLLALYLAENRLDDARRHLSNPDERTLFALFAWAYVLERFLAADLAGAAQALAHARTQNPHAQIYFLEHRRLPESPPYNYEPGSEEEAIVAWHTLKIAWQAHPKAQTWLREQCCH